MPNDPQITQMGAEKNVRDPETYAIIGAAMKFDFRSKMFDVIHTAPKQKIR